MIKTHDIGFYIKPALKLKICIFACKMIRVKNDDGKVQRFDGLPETAVPILKLYYQKTKIQPAAGDGGSSTKVVRAAAADGGSSTKVVYYQRTKIQPAAGDGGSSTKVVLPESENPAGRRRRRFQY